MLRLTCSWLLVASACGPRAAVQIAADATATPADTATLTCSPIPAPHASGGQGIIDWQVELSTPGILQRR